MKNHHVKEFRHLREVVLYLHNFKCFICGCRVDPMEVHHINKDSSDNRLQNLIPVCVVCHRLIGKSSKLSQLTVEFLAKLLLKCLIRLKTEV